MKIAFIDVTTTVSFGGIQTAIWQLARELVDQGHEVHVFGGEGDIRPDLAGRAVQIHTFAFTPREKVLDLGNRFRRIWERYSFSKHARKTVIDLDFDWIVLTKPFDFFWPRLLPQGSKTRSVFMSGGTSFFRGDRWLSKRLDAWVACSHFNAWQIGARFKRFPQVMYNGVDIRHFCPATDTTARQALREQLGVKPDELLIGFAGRLEGLKGVEFAIRALADSALAGQSIRLLVIGHGRDQARLERIAHSCGVTDKVIFNGAVPHADLPKYYTACDLGVFPSVVDEAFGIAIAEAMACALPVVATYIGGIPEVVGNEGGCGLLVPPKDAGAIAQAFATLCNDAALRRQMGQAARTRIANNFTWTMATNRFLEALKKPGEGRT